MFNPDEKIIECALGKKEFFLAGQESLECCVFISDVGTRVYLSLTLGTWSGQFKQLD